MLDSGYYPKECELALRRMYTQRLTALKPNIFLTISLFKRNNEIAPEHLLERRSEDFERLHIEMFNRIDRQLYGARHHKLPDEGKFGYFCRLETKDRRYYRVNPHYHILIHFSPEELERFQQRWPSIYESLHYLLEARGFVPDIDCLEHDGNNLSYSVKHPLTDLLRMHDRNLHL